MKTDFEALGITCTQVGDYFLPDVEAPESPQVGIWGQRRRKYLWEHKKVLYTNMLLEGTPKGRRPAFMADSDLTLSTLKGGLAMT